MKKRYAEEFHYHFYLNLLVVFLIIMSASLYWKTLEQQKEIDLMPHYECKNITTTNIINDTENTCGFGTHEMTDNYNYLHCMDYSKNPQYIYEAECFNDSKKCYVKETKEVCKIK